MKERGIIFSAPMVRALLIGTKTQTRRIVQLPEFGPSSTYGWDWDFRDRRGRWNSYTTKQLLETKCPYGSRGDRLWVKEAHQYAVMANETIVAYRATCEDDAFDYVDPAEGSIERIQVHKWKPAIFMRRLESRIDLEVTEVRVQRLLDVTEDDAKAEGVEPFFTRFPCIGRDQRITDGKYARDEEHRASFACLWDEINGDRALWNTNPWVWAISFRRLEVQP